MMEPTIRGLTLYDARELYLEWSAIASQSSRGVAQSDWEELGRKYKRTAQAVKSIIQLIKDHDATSKAFTNLTDEQREYVRGTRVTWVKPMATKELVEVVEPEVTKVPEGNCQSCTVCKLDRVIALLEELNSKW